MEKHLEQQLVKIEGSLAPYREMLSELGRDITRMFKAVRDEYYEAALTHAGSLIEDILREIWKLEKISGKETKKTIEQLFAVIKNQVEIDRLAEDYIRDIQLARNRAAHGEKVVPEDAIETLRKVITVVAWFAEKYRPDVHGAAAQSHAQESRPAHRTEAPAPDRVLRGERLEVAAALRSGGNGSGSSQEGRTLVLEISREGSKLKISTMEKAAQDTDTLRHYDEKEISMERVDAKCRDIVRLLNNANVRGKLSGTLLSQLKLTGSTLCEELLTHDVQKKLASSPSKNLILNIDDNLVHIPWELMHDGQQFLCRKFNAGRIVRTRQKVTPPKAKALQLPLKTLIVCDPTEDLQKAGEEGARLLAEFDSHLSLGHANLVNRKLNQDMLREEMYAHDIVHFAGHADHDPESPEESGWLLDGDKLTCRDIMNMSRNLPMPSLIFSNACQSGQTSAWTISEGFEQRIFGLANAFLLSGVQHYVGTFWEVLDEAGCEFSMAFYKSLLGGEAIGAALRKAREHLVTLYGEDNIIWASYVLYGNPEAFYFTDSAHAARPAQPQAAQRQRLPEEPALAAAGATRAHPASKAGAKLVGFSAAALAIAAALLFLVFYRGGIEVTVAGKKPQPAAAPEKRQEVNLDQAMAALSEKYRQQKASQPAAADDPWTSRPLTFSLFDFSSDSAVSGGDQTAGQLLTTLSGQLTGSGRISLVERQKIDVLLTELKLSTSDFADQDSALIMLGRLLGARLICIGKISALKGDMTANLRVFETDSSRIVISIDQDLREGQVKECAGKIAASLIQQICSRYPVKGKIVRVAGAEAILNVGMNTGAQAGMKLRVLSGPEVRDSRGKLLGYDDREIGTLEITKVEDKLCRAAVTLQKETVGEGMRVAEVKQ